MSKKLLATLMALAIIAGSLATFVVFNAFAAGEYHDGSLSVGLPGDNRLTKMNGQEIITMAGEHSVAKLRFAEAMGIPAGTTLTDLTIKIQYNYCKEYNDSWWRMSDAGYVDRNDRHEMFWWNTNDSFFKEDSNKGWTMATVFDLTGTTFTYGGVHENNGNYITEYTVNEDPAGYDITLENNNVFYISYIEVTVEGAKATWGAPFAAKEGPNFLPLTFNWKAGERPRWTPDVVDGYSVLRCNNDFYPSLFINNVFEVIPMGTDQITCEVVFMPLTGKALDDPGWNDTALNNDNEQIMFSYKKISEGGDEDLRFNTGSLERGAWYMQMWEAPNAYQALQYGLNVLTLKACSTYGGIAVRSIKLYDPDNPDTYLLWDPTYEDPIVEPSLTTPKPPATNVALNKTADASHVYDRDDVYHGIEHAVDGDINSRWATGDDLGGGDANIERWWMVDLGGLYDLENIKIFWEEAYAKDLKVQVSANGTDFIDKITKTDLNVVHSFKGEKVETDWDFPAGTQAQYVKILMTKGVLFGSTFYGYSFYEVEIYGTPAGGPTDPTTPTDPTGTEPTTPTSEPT
ncbi:MAG: discoidin domain-containing protein, partial [Oscillospiraceae bacterium]|nr:discoidin domain-containing protein [Oscillospiraceae bacterium]